MPIALVRRRKFLPHPSRRDCRVHLEARPQTFVGEDLLRRRHSGGERGRRDQTKEGWVRERGRNKIKHFDRRSSSEYTSCTRRNPEKKHGGSITNRKQKSARPCAWKELEPGGGTREVTVKAGTRFLGPAAAKCDCGSPLFLLSLNPMA